MDELTAAAASALIGKNEKTVRRWIDAGQLSARKQSGVWMIARADLASHMPAQPEASTPEAARSGAPAPDMSAMLAARVESMAARIAELERRIVELEARPAPAGARQVAPAPAQATFFDSAEPEPDMSGMAGDVSLREFAGLHKVKENTAISQAVTGKVEISRRPLGSRPGQEHKYLTPAQQCALAEYWRRNGTPGFTPCPACPHKQRHEKGKRRP